MKRHYKLLLLANAPVSALSGILAFLGLLFSSFVCEGKAIGENERMEIYLQGYYAMYLSVLLCFYFLILFLVRYYPNMERINLKMMRLLKANLPISIVSGFLVYFAFILEEFLPMTQSGIFYWPSYYFVYLTAFSFSYFLMPFMELVGSNRNI